MRNRIFCNLEFLFLFTFEGNIQCAIKVLRLAMEHADGDKCNVFFARSNDGIFWGKKLKLSLSACQKTLLSYVNLTYSRLKGQGILSLDINKIIRLQVTLDSPHQCKECFHISNRPYPIHVHSHEISRFLDTET